MLADATKNLILRTVKKIINYCLANGVIETNPLISIKKWKTSPRLVELNREQEKRLLEACQTEAPHLYPALMFSLRNPIRVGDLSALTRKCLDIDSMTVTYTSQKTGVTAVCNIYPELEEYFRTLPPEKECEYLFHYKYNKKYFPLGDFRKSWNKVKEGAGIDKSLRWHDLRHHSCAYLLKQGIPTTSVQKIGGWKSIQMVELYNTGNAIEAARLTREQLLRQIPKVQKKRENRKASKATDTANQKKGVSTSVPVPVGCLLVPQGERSVVPAANG